MPAERFAALLQSLGPFSATPHFAVALSGGADSLALTLLIQDYVAVAGGHVTALTVDHRLRAESTAEAQQVAAQMRTLGIDHHILTPAHDGASNNLQESARNWRYGALSEYCRNAGILHCLVAHNAGDNRETAHHNMARGETADGASGMRAARNLQGVRFLRPLLSIARDELEHYLRSKDVTWISDPSNSNERFARVRTRQTLQRNPAESTLLDATIRRERAERVARDHALAQAAMQCVTIHPQGFADIDLAQWRKLEPMLASQLVADCITTISGGTSRPRGSDTQRLVAALEGDFTARTLQHCELSVEGARLRIARELSRVQEPITLTGNGEARWDGRFTVHHALPDGTSYRLGALGSAGLKLARAQWPASAQLPASTPALWHLDELAFLPHMEVPHLAAHAVRIGFSPAKPLAASPFW